MLNPQQSVANDEGLEEMSIPVSSMFLSTTRSTRLNPTLHNPLLGTSSHNAISLQLPTTIMECHSPSNPVHVQPPTDTTHHQLVTISGIPMENVDQHFSATNDAALLALAQESFDLNSPNRASSTTYDGSIYDFQNQMELSVFKDIRDVDAIVAAYEKRSGNRLRIIRSGKEKYRTYECCGHVHCNFQLRFSKSKRDGYYSLRTKEKKLVHTFEKSPNLSSDRRKPKKRRRGTLDDVLDRVITTKHALPTPADVIKTAATMNNEVLDYQTAWRYINHGVAHETRLPQ